MGNIFNAKDNQEIITRINNLSVNSQAVWGKMTVSQMLKHCQQPLNVAEGKLEVKRTIIGILFGKMFKNKFLKENFSKNSPTDKAFIIHENPDFDKMKQDLAQQVESFAQKGPAIIKVLKHPFFGNMTSDEWGIISYRHLDHHLRQFGV